jgi:GNAT superfamily N-acetyltransferase
MPIKYDKVIDFRREALAEAGLRIRELQTDELYMTVPLLSQLYSQVSTELLLTRLAEISGLNWRCVGVFDQNIMIGLSGYWFNTRLYCGKYLYIDHFVIDNKRRGDGVGTQLLAYLKQLAKDKNCEQVCLDTFVANSLAQSFWLRHGFNIVGFHFIAQ